MSSLGIGTEATWAGLCAGRSGIRRVTRFDVSAFACQIAGEVDGFDPLNYVDKKEVKKIDTFIQYAIAASDFAMKSAGLTITPAIAPRVGVFIGSGIGGFGTIEREHKAYLDGGPRRISPFFIPSAIINLLPASVDPVRSQGAELGDGDGLLGVGARHRRRRRDDPPRRGRRDDRGRLGSRHHAHGPRRVRRHARAVDAQRRAREGVPAVRQGSRRLHHRRRRRRPHPRGAGNAGAQRPIYAELVGYGMSGDAFHITTPSEDGDGGYRVMKQALASAGITPAGVQYINAHGTSTEYNDRTETLAIKRVFGDHAYKVAISSTKSMTGHLLGAAGGLEAGISVLAIHISSCARPTSTTRTPTTISTTCRRWPRRMYLRALELVRVRRHQRRAGLQEVRILVSRGEGAAHENRRLSQARRDPRRGGARR